MTSRQKSIILFPINLLYSINKKLGLKVLFRIKNGYSLNLENPTTYYEKLQWVKLNYKHPLLTKLVDKYTVREYIQEKCPEILNKLLWNGFDAKEIPWDDLPEKFVIKVTHGSGFNIICKDKSKLDTASCEKKLNKWLKEKYIKCYGEWFYGVERPRIIIEEYLDNGNGNVPEDYKVFCFDGKPKYILVDTGRYIEHKRNVYDTEWNFKEGYTVNFTNDVPMGKPENLSELLRYAEILSEGFPHVRVDLYSVKGKVYFGEMTFTNGAGYGRINPPEFNTELGSYFDLREN